MVVVRGPTLHSNRTGLFHHCELAPLLTVACCQPPLSPSHLPGKVKSNIEEVIARKGTIIIVTDEVLK
jgi:hypothetical protein